MFGFNLGSTGASISLWSLHAPDGCHDTTRDCIQHVCKTVQTLPGAEPGTPTGSAEGERRDARSLRPYSSVSSPGRRAAC